MTLSLSSQPSTASPAACLPAAGVLDAQALARLCELDPGGKAGLLARVLNTYRVSLQRFLGQLQVARSDADLQTQRHVAHTLKSSSASVGALSLSAICADVERLLREDPAGGETLDERLDALAAEGQRLLLALGES